MLNVFPLHLDLLNLVNCLLSILIIFLLISHYLKDTEYLYIYI